MKKTELLRIKDGIDLKNLELWGFVDDGNWFYVYNVRNTDEEIVNIKVCKDTRVIDIEWRTHYIGRSFTIRLGIIYDLIQLGIVEKVEV